MNHGYCGKDCMQCACREQTACPGCKNGPGRPLYGDCEIALCCRNKNHGSCDTCTNNRHCGKRSRKDSMPERRARKQAEEAVKRAELARRAPFLGRWLWILFWLVIPSTVASLLAMDAMAGWAPNVYLFGKILNVVCSLLYGLILLKLAAECFEYRTAGVLRLVTAAVSLLLVLVAGKNTAANWTLLITLPGAVVSLVATYQLYMAHGVALNGVDTNQAEKWRMLWKWHIGTYGAVIGSVVLILIFRVLGLLVMFAAFIGIVVVGILELVYLYQTAKIFREYPC